MKKTLFLTCLWLLWAQMGNSQAPSNLLPAQQHLQLVNAEWLKYTELAPVETVSFNTDAGRIQLHLNLVVEHLRSKSAALTSEQLYQRERLLDTLQHYARQGVFPINLYHEGRRPYFIDHRNTHCAVGYLMKASGHGDLAQRISQEHNYDYVADIETEGLMEWAQQHGFALDELAWIQPSYPDIRKTVSIGGGVSGEVKALEEVYLNGQTGILVTGDFDSIGTTYCNGIGFYANGNWQCLDEGIDGSTGFIEPGYSGEVTVCGDYTYNGKQYPVAVHKEGIGWTFPEKPKDADMIGTSSFYYWGTYTTYYFPEKDLTELWKKTMEEEFIHVMDIKGSINDVTSYERTINGHRNTTIVYGGAFSQIKASGTDEWMESNSLFFLTDIGSEVPFIVPSKEKVQDTVLTLQGDERVIYIGGTCKNGAIDYQKNCVLKLLDTLLIPLVRTDSIYGSLEKCPCRINGLAFSDDGTLVFGGKFQVASRAISSGLGEYDPLREEFDSYRNVKGHVNAIARMHTGYMAFGGSFDVGHSYRTSSRLNNLGQTYDEVGIDDRQASSLALYPNPATNALSIQLKNKDRIERIQIKSINGQVLQETQGQGNSSLQIQLVDLSSGLYLTEVTTHEGQVWVQKLMIR